MNLLMISTPITQTLADGRLHLSHGPIDLIIEAWGSGEAVDLAYEAANGRFETILAELVEELPCMRQPVSDLSGLTGPVAQRMFAATKPFEGIFITPMAAVAGAVADEVLAVMRKTADLTKVYVNNAGDIAVWVGPGENLQIAMVDDLKSAYLQAGAPQKAQISIGHGDKIGGIATSGWRGRSHSLGIADAVCVLAKNAALADATASLIANAVDISSDKVTREAASSLDPDSDLGDRPVTTAVDILTNDEIETALANGAKRAEAFCNKGLIQSVAIALAGHLKIVNNNVIAVTATS